MGNLLKIFKVPERSKIENTTGPGSGTYQVVEQTIPGGEKPVIPGYSLEEVIFESSSSRIKTAIPSELLCGYFANP